jgi:hypothetical protein
MKIKPYSNVFITRLQLFVITVVLTASCSWASTTEARLNSDRIVYTGPEGKVAVILSGLRHGDQIQVSVRFGDKVIKVPKRFMFEAKGILEETIRLRVPSPNPKVPLWKQAADTGFFIYFEFGGTYDHGTKDKPVEVYKAMMIEFEHGELKNVELALPAGEHKNQWIYHYRSGGVMHKDGKEEVGKYTDARSKSIRCSWARSDGQ